MPRGFIAELLTTRKPATASNRYRALQAFFGWCVRESEIERSPMEMMRPPSLPETPVPVLNDDQLRTLLKSCEGKTFEDRRDMAMIRLLLDTGMRRGELAGMAVVDVDFELDVALVVGKGSRPRACPFGKRTAVALDRYLRERVHHPHGDLKALWLGQRGAVKPNGVQQIVEKRGRRAGIQGLHPHQLRHTSLRRGFPRVATKVISCGSRAGARERCSTATEPLRPMSGPGKHTGASVREIASRTGSRLPLTLGIQQLRLANTRSSGSPR